MGCGLEVVDRRLLRAFGQLEAGLVEGDVDDRGRSVLGDHADAVGELDERRAQLDLLGLRRRVRRARHPSVVLLLVAAPRSARRAAPAAGRAPRAARAGARPPRPASRAAVSCACAGVELRLAGVELRLPGVELRSPVVDLRLRVGELLRAVRLLLLRVERVDHRRDVVEVLGAGRGIRDRLLLLVGEGRAVGRLIDDGCRHAGAVGKLLRELVDDRARGRAGDVEAVAERRRRRRGTRRSRRRG